MPEIPSLGPRGEGWVVLQFALIAAVFVGCVTGPRWPDAVAGGLFLAGWILAAAGALLAFESARALGKGLTPFARPPEDSRLVEHGPYRVVRHPLYAGGTFFFTGFSLAFSPVALALTAALTVLWGTKARVEERFLQARFPAYGAYAERTRYRLIPFVY